MNVHKYSLTNNLRGRVSSIFDKFSGGPRLKSRVVIQTEEFLIFPQFLHSSAEVVAQIKSRTLLFASLPIHYSLSSFHSKLSTSSLNKLYIHLQCGRILWAHAFMNASHNSTQFFSYEKKTWFLPNLLGFLLLQTSRIKWDFNNIFISHYFKFALSEIALYIKLQIIEYILAVGYY
jgi:hypothetical protein